MGYYLERLQAELVRDIAGKIEIDSDNLVIESANPKFESDLAIPMFAVASQVGKSPDDIAKEVSSWLSNQSIARVEAISGFVNIWLKPKQIVDGLAKDIESHHPYGSTNDGQGKTVIVDFIGLNLSKPFSVGHLRPTVQGAALINIYRALGYRVIGDSHLGDWGTPFGMWVAAYEKWGDEKALEEKGAYELGELYARFRQEAEKDEALFDEAKTWLKKLEDGDEQATAYKDKFSQISFNHMNSILKRLKIQPDENYAESFYVADAKNFVNDMVENGIAEKQDDESIIVRLDEYDIDTPILLQKSDGSLLYATTDIQTIRFRQEKWQPEKIIYSVGSEQQFYFKQVFALADKLDYEMELAHPWFGTVDEIDEHGQRTKMSSRKSTALLENLLDKAEEEAAQRIKGEGIDKEDIKKVAIGAIKFTDFAQARKTNILFDWNRMFNLQGFSGPYVQYAAVRVNSILNKLDAQESPLEPVADYEWQEEAELLKMLATYPLVIRAAAEEYEPHKVAQYVYDLARQFNKYYENVSISGSEGVARQARIQLLFILKHNFEHALGLLGIEVPEKM